MANLHVNHYIISVSRRFDTHNPVRIRRALLNEKRWPRFRFQISSLSDRSSSALVQQRPPAVDEAAANVIDQTSDVEFGRKKGSTTNDDEDDDDDERGVVDEYLAREYGWKVRRMVEEKSEMRKVAQIQGEAFHVPAPFFDDFFFYFFQAEVLSGLLYRLRNSPPDRYACLVAEPAKEDETTSKSQPQEGQQKLVGVVDVTVLRDRDVLQHLEGAEEYLYVSGIAVSNNHRRQKVATVLLKACEVISVLWRHEYLVLRAYEDDKGARALYTNAGYRLVSGDPPWLAWIGRRRRILLIKRLW